MSSNHRDNDNDNDDGDDETEEIEGHGRSETSHLLSSTPTPTRSTDDNNNTNNTEDADVDALTLLPRLSQGIINSSFPQFTRYHERREAGETSFLSTYGSTSVGASQNKGSPPSTSHSPPIPSSEAFQTASSSSLGTDTPGPTQAAAAAAGYLLTTPQAIAASTKWRLDDFNIDSKSNTPLNATATQPEESPRGAGATGTSHRQPLAARIVPSIRPTHSAENTIDPPPHDTRDMVGAPPINMPSNHTNIHTSDAGNRQQPMKSMWGFLTLVALSLIASFAFLKHSIDLQNQRLSDLDTRVNNLDSVFKQFKSDTQNTLAKLQNDMKAISDQERQLEALAKVEFDRNKDSIAQLQNNSNATRSWVSILAVEVNQHDASILRLNNRTSNADVLDQLKLTRQRIDSDLITTKEHIAQSLDSTQRHVDNQLTQTHSELNQTISYMQMLVASAANEIYSVQEDVTGQLSLMEDHLQATVDDLNLAVDSAKATISEEVAGVKEDIEKYVAATNEEFAVQNDFVKYQLAGTFTLLGCLISLWHITSHLRHYNKPDVQRRVMAVLWMVPIYGITSWLSLVAPSLEYIFGAVRDCYEAYAVYTFIGLLIAILEDGRGLPDLIQTLAHHVQEERNAISEALVQAALSPTGSDSTNVVIPTEHIVPPFPCCYNNENPYSVASVWLHQCMIMALQFVLFKPILTIVPFIVSMMGYDYDVSLLADDHSVNWVAPKLYVLIAQNISVAVAFYGLLSFYHGTEKDLAWCEPWPKFLCIKGVVFMTFWQGAVLQGMSSTGIVSSHSAGQFQNLLICIEMLLASIAHFYIFPYQEWREGYRRTQRDRSLVNTLALPDFVRDMRRMVFTRWDNLPPNTAEPTDAGSNPNTASPVQLLAAVTATDGDRTSPTTPSELLAIAAQLDRLESGERPAGPGPGTSTGAGSSPGSVASAEPYVAVADEPPSSFAGQMSSLLANMWSPFIGVSSGNSSSAINRPSLSGNSEYNTIADNSEAQNSEADASEPLLQPERSSSYYQASPVAVISQLHQNSRTSSGYHRSTTGSRRLVDEIHDEKSDGDDDSKGDDNGGDDDDDDDEVANGDQAHHVEAYSSHEDESHEDEDGLEYDTSQAVADNVNEQQVSNLIEEDQIEEYEEYEDEDEEYIDEEEGDDEDGDDDDEQLQVARAPFKHVSSPDANALLDALDRQLAEERSYVEASMRDSIALPVTDATSHRPTPDTQHYRESR